MKRITTTIFLFISFCILFLSCEKEDENNSQAAIVFVQHYYSGRRAPDWEPTYIPSISVTADIIGNPVPEIKYVQIADRHFIAPALFNVNQGKIHFSSYSRIWTDSIAEPKLNPLTIKINTSIGGIEGSISVPDTIKTFTIDAADTIPLGTSISLSWTGSNAEYYYLSYYHNWMEAEGYWLGYFKDTIVTDNNITFDGSNFLKDGDISDFEICPINGPLPEVGAKANMNGDGFGFLYLENSTKSSDKFITIGNGIYFPDFEKSAILKSKHSSTAMHEKVKKLLKL